MVPFPAPASERCSLTVQALDVTGHPDGCALRFGPGPEVEVFPPSTYFTMRGVRLTAAFAVAYLDEVLAKAPSRRVG